MDTQTCAHDFFPLTPALSLWERENGGAASSERITLLQWTVAEAAQGGTERLPLPEGEGRGEGEARAELDPCPKLELPHASRQQ